MAAKAQQIIDEIRLKNPINRDGSAVHFLGRLDLRQYYSVKPGSKAQEINSALDHLEKLLMQRTFKAFIKGEAKGAVQQLIEAMLIGSEPDLKDLTVDSKIFAEFSQQIGGER